jgi:hypothetical protein
LLYGECTVKDGRIEQTNFDTYNSMRIAEMPKVESIIMPSGGFWRRRRRADDLRRRPRRAQCVLRGNRQAYPIGPAQEPQHLVRVMKRSGAGADPVPFRLAHMKDARVRAVIEAAVLPLGLEPV